MTFGPATGAGHEEDSRNVSATWVCKGASAQHTGQATIIAMPTGTQELLDIFYEASGHPVAILQKGPNPPPPPPPPPACATSYNQTTCDAVTPANACSWCTSNDKLHALCFDAKNKPPSASWSCDR